MIDRGALTFAVWAVGLLTIAGGALLLIGFLTPITCVMVGAGSAGVALSWFPFLAPDLFEAKLAALLVSIIAAAVLLLGPGAFSLDARLFGRREIIIPHAPRPPKP